METKVTSFRTLNPGDHIAWERAGGIYSHHAIVVKVLSDYKLEVIHNTTVTAKGEKAANGGGKGKILKGIVDVDLSKGDLYLCNYEPGACLEPDEVIARAESQLGKKNYNVLENNCEHFATYCKTSRHVSKQVTAFFESIRALVRSIGAKVAEEGVLCGIASKLQNLPTDKVLRCSFKGAIRRLIGPGVARGLKAVTIAVGVGINLAVEGAVFGLKTHRAFREYERGEITHDEFRAKRAEAGCLSGIRCAGSLIGGVIGQILIPVPFLGGLIGCAVGCIAGHFLGKIAGKRCAEYERGEITHDEFRAKRADAGCLSGIRCAGSLIGGVIGQILIPVPFLGGLIGCAVGCIAGHFLGK